MKPILEIKGISKKFRIHHERQSYQSIRDNIVSAFKRKEKREDEDFWALKDINFNVEAGESLGIIGKNGAGKSTLLKILSRITPPTAGKIISRGRIASLLEVGTGFHGELSGKENIFLNGSILGMKRREIESKFDAITDFSGVEKFMDTPLKHYSSGMQLRLAFAVAAFLDPEILIIDEVLAVGDAEFQKKCMGKMDEISHKEGRTILFVSHNLQAVQDLCAKCVSLNHGQIQMIGKTPDVIRDYMKFEMDFEYVRNKELSGKPLFRKASIVDENNNPVTSVENGKKIRVKLDIWNPEKKNLEVTMSFFDAFERKIWNFTHDMYGYPLLPANENIECIVTFSPPLLTANELYLHVGLFNPRRTIPYDQLAPALKFKLLEKKEFDINFIRRSDCPIFCETTMEV